MKAPTDLVPSPEPSPKTVVSPLIEPKSIETLESSKSYDTRKPNEKWGVCVLFIKVEKELREEVIREKRVGFRRRQSREGFEGESGDGGSVMLSCAAFVYLFTQPK